MLINSYYSYAIAAAPPVLIALISLLLLLLLFLRNEFILLLKEPSMNENDLKKNIFFTIRCAGSSVLVQTKRINSLTPRNGLRTGSSSPSSAEYSNANVDAAWTAASASTSHLALLTDAAAANNVENIGKNATIAISADNDANVPVALNVSKNGNSTIAAVAAAHNPDNADVNGNIAADRAP
jgi:hypothetical protein